MMRVKRLDLHCTGINIETKWSLVVILCVFHQNWTRRKYHEAYNNYIIHERASLKRSTRYDEYIELGHPKVGAVATSLRLSFLLSFHCLVFQVNGCNNNIILRFVSH